ncbi:MAG: cell division protein SepF [Defluviitaleaceae bacterium]|nr:cell division protein SepF [Defluviitaleaceae bacterium]
MKKFFEKIKSSIIGEDADDEYEYYEEEYEEVPLKRTNTYNRTRGSNVVNFNKEPDLTPDYSIEFFEPKTIEDSAIIVESIKNNNRVIVNLEGVDNGTAQRLSDIISATANALDFNIKRASEGSSQFIAYPSYAEVYNADEVLRNAKTVSKQVNFKFKYN